MDIEYFIKSDALGVFEIIMAEYIYSINNKSVFIFGEDRIIQPLTQLLTEEGAKINDKSFEKADILIAFSDITYAKTAELISKGGLFVLCGKEASSFISSSQFKSIRILRLESGRKFI